MELWLSSPLSVIINTRVCCSHIDSHERKSVVTAAYTSVAYVHIFFVHCYALAEMRTATQPPAKEDGLPLTHTVKVFPRKYARPSRGRGFLSVWKA